MTQVKLLGLGSPLGDDRLGWLAALQLREALSSEAIEIEICDRPGAGLLALIAGAKVVILIDALLADLPVGSLLSFRNEELRAARTPLSSHAFGVAEALALGRTLDCLPEEIVLFGLVVDPANQTAELSPAVQKQIPALIKKISDYLKISAAM